MFYHVIIEINEKTKKGDNKQYLELDKTNLLEIENNVINPYLNREEFQFAGYFLKSSDIKAIKIKESHSNSNELLEIAQSNIAKNVLFVCSKNMVINSDKYTVDITNNIFNKVKSSIPIVKKIETKTIELTAIEKINNLIKRFHQVAMELRSRRAGRVAVEIEDEYDVQYLFNALLKVYFDDVRPEEYTPSYAGSASRVDFLLKSEKIIIEIKKTRNGLGAREIGEQLIIDSLRYQSHPDCDNLICFVYDPDGIISNPRGIENDLTREVNGVPISVFIRPEHL